MSDVRPERRILLELDALLRRIADLAAAGDRSRYDSDDEYRWVLHRLWIAVGNEAAAYAELTGAKSAAPWRPLALVRNKLAHVRLADIDEDEVWRLTALRPALLREQIRQLLR